MKKSENNRGLQGFRQVYSASRDHLLDVRIRRSTAKRQYLHRIWNMIFGIVLWIGLATATYFGFRAVVNKFFLENSEYNLRVVDAELDELMSREEAMKIAGITFGKNIFRIDLSKAEHELRKIDQIEAVTLQRDWPDRITIKLKKRIPVAWLTQSSNFSTEHALLLDAKGHTINPYRIEPEYWRLPVIYTNNPELTQTQDPLALSDLQAALNLIAARKNQPDSLLEIQSIDITKGYALEVVDANKARITFAPQDPGDQLLRLQKLLVNSRDHGRRIESVNMIPKKYTPVRFLTSDSEKNAVEKQPQKENQ